MSDRATRSLNRLIDEAREAVIKSAKAGVKASAEITASGVMGYTKGRDIDLGLDMPIIDGAIKASVETGLENENQSSGSGSWWVRVTMETP